MPVRPQIGIGLSGPKASVTGSTRIGGSSAASLNVGYNPLAGTAGVTPKIRIGNSKNSGRGATVGSIGGSALGSGFGPAGSAAGSAIGSAGLSAVASASDKYFGGGKDSEERKKRDKLLGYYREAGLIDPDFDHEATHEWKNPNRRVDGIGERALHGYEIDYTNDLDYVAGMSGITLSRMLAGATGKAIDQSGNAIGNNFLKEIGTGNELTPENFNKLMEKSRAGYSKAGIKSKEDALSLANQMYAEGRINDFDHSVMQQTAGLVFDNDFGTAQQLMGGRWEGVKTASKTPSSSARSGQKRMHSPKLSAQEAMASVRPYFDEYRKRHPLPKGKKPSKIAEGVGLVSALAGAYSVANKASDGAIGGFIKDTVVPAVKGGFQDFAEYIGLTESADPIEIEIDDVSDDADLIDFEIPNF